MLNFAFIIFSVLILSTYLPLLPWDSGVLASSLYPNMLCFLLSKNLWIHLFLCLFVTRLIPHASILSSRVTLSRKTSLTSGSSTSFLLKQDSLFFSEKLLVYHKLIRPITYLFPATNITSRKQTLLAFSYPGTTNVEVSCIQTVYSI